MAQNQLLFMCKLNRFLAIIITEEKLEKYKGTERPGDDHQKRNRQVR